MRQFLRDQSLSLFFGLLFLAALVAQSVAGHHSYNQDQLAHHAAAVSYGRYLLSSEFGQAVMENWQSEYLQFALFIFATIHFVQRGSPESKQPDRRGRGTMREQRMERAAGERSPKWARVGGVRTVVYANSLLLVMGLMWVGSWFAQSVTGWTQYNHQQTEHHQSVVSWVGYLKSADFWENTLQNWQSELLAVGSFAILAVYLRQRGSPESKPVGAPHEATGVEGA